MWKLLRNIGFFIALPLLGFLLNPLNLHTIFGYVLILPVFLNISFVRKSVDLDFLLILLFSLTYAMFYAFNPQSGGQYIVIYSVLPITFYLLGKYLFKRIVDHDYSTSLPFIIIGFIYSLSALISIWINILDGGFGQLQRSIPFFWSDDPVTATIMGSFFTLNMCLPSILIVFPKRRNNLFKIAVVVIFTLSLLCVIRIGSRTQIAVCLFTLLSTLIFIVPRQSLRRNILMFTAFAIGLTILIMNVSFDLSEDWLSAFAGRMEKGGAGDIASGGGRTERWSRSIANLFEKPLGWSVKEFGHAHNFWLDVLRVAGIIPFSILIVYSIRCFIKVRKALAVDINNFAFNNQIRVISLAFFLVFMVEPTMEGTFSLFLIFCMFMGYINTYSANQPDKR